MALRSKIVGMDCGSCALSIEDGVRKLAGVTRVSVDFTTENIEVDGPVTRDAVAHRLRQLGYRLAQESTAAQQAETATAERNFLSFFWSQPRQRLAVAAGATALLATAVASLAPQPTTESLAQWTLIAAVLLIGAPIFAKGLRALIFSRRITIDLLMTIAALGALLIGAASEATAVVVLFTLGEGLEAFSAARARASLRSLMALQPQTATVLRSTQEDHSGCDHEPGDTHGHDHAHQSHGPEADTPHVHQHGDEHGACDHEHGHGHSHEARAAQVAEAPVGHVESHLRTLVVPVEELARGERMLVRPGERIAADGIVRSGTSSLNQAAITGESRPVPKAVGDEVMAGTVNMDAVLEIEVSRIAADSTIARIGRLIEQAQAQRSPAERFIDRFARWYTPAVVVLALAVVAVPVLVFGAPLLNASGALGGIEHGWLYRGLTLLIVACPCALVISIPVTVVSSLTRLAGLGVLVKGGEQLDRLADVRAIAFDKTGTLTLGRPSVTATWSRHCTHVDQPLPDCGGCDDVIALAASIESGSAHPIAYAIMESARARGLGHRYPLADSVLTIAGRGLVGSLLGETIAVGNGALLQERGIATDGDGLPPNLRRTVMLVARGREFVGAIGVEDAVRPESAAALATLRQVAPDVRTVMLTGDDAGVAADIAQRVGGIDQVLAGLMPEQKLDAIRSLQGQYGSVAMIGDGVNDAPALARADVGIAMGASGTAQAMDTAHVVLMRDDLGRVPVALRIARRNRALVKQNIALSLGLKVAVLALVVPGLATLWMAVLADVGATVLVTLNGMRMLRSR